MWTKLEKDHPLLYEVIWWSVTGLELASIIISIIVILQRCH